MTVWNKAENYEAGYCREQPAGETIQERKDLILLPHRKGNKSLSVRKSDAKKKDDTKAEIFRPQNSEKMDISSTDMKKRKQESTKKSNDSADNENTKNSQLTLNQMSEEILKKVKIILHDNSLYYYSGRTYQLIEGYSDLVKVIRKKVSHTVFECMTLKRLTDLKFYMETDEQLIPYDYEERLEKSKYYIGLKNGILDLRRMKLLPYSSEYLIFYEVNAMWKENAKMPFYFQKFLSQISGNDKEIEQRILEVIGYLLTPINDGKYFFVMGTAPNSGKSTLGELLKKMLGNKLIATRSVQQINNRFVWGDIQGKLINMSLDLPRGKLNTHTVSIIKQISGGDTITAEQKYERMKEVHTNMRFLFGSNFPVTVPQEEDDEAFWNRMVIVPFLYSIKKGHEDFQLLNHLWDERDAIVSLCLRAMGNILQNHCIFSPCKAAEQMKFNWRYHEYDDTETVEAFVERYVEVTGNPRDQIYSQQLYQIYREFCEKHGDTGLSYLDFLSWMCRNIDECQKKRIHKTGMNPRAGLTGIKIKD